MQQNNYNPILIVARRNPPMVRNRTEFNYDISKKLETVQSGILKQIANQEHHD